jgi:cell division protein FtsW
MKHTLARLLRRGTKGDQAADSTPEETATAKATAAEPRTRFGAWLGRPMTSFHLIIAIAALLTTLGLIMVLSASGVRSYDDDGSAWVVDDRRAVRLLPGAAVAGAVHAAHGVLRLRRDHCDVGAGADPGNR